MKQHTSEFKEELITHGKQQDVIITFDDVTLGMEDLNAVTPNYKGGLLKSVMKGVEIDSNVEIPVGKEISISYGLLINNEFEYINFGNYIVHSSEKQEDTGSYSIIAYDRMLLAMKDYVPVDIQYPCSVYDYLNAVCNDIGLELVTQTFPNYDQELARDFYMRQNEQGVWESLGYKYRDVLDDIAEVSASTIYVDGSYLYVGQPTETNDVIDEDFMKSYNITFGKKFGPVNSIVLSRSESDNIFIQDAQSVEDNGLCEVKIKDNQIMNDNTRDRFLPGLLQALDGMEFYLNDFVSPGVVYLDLLDRYTVRIGEETYSCVMFADEVDITQGLEEHIYTDEPEISNTDYSKADKTDRKLNETSLIVDKQGQQIQAVIREIGDRTGRETTITQDLDNIVFSVQNTGGNNLIKNSVMFDHGVDDNQQVVASSWEIEGEGTIVPTVSSDATNNGSLSGHVFILNDKLVKQRINVKANDETDNNRTYYTFSTLLKKNATGTCYCKIYNDNEEYYVVNRVAGESDNYKKYSVEKILPTMNYYWVEFYGSSDSDATFTDNMFAVGEYTTQWQQANGEIMNALVKVNSDGMTVKSSQNEGDYTKITPAEFAGYSVVDGQLKRVFSLNKDTTEMEKIEVRKQIDMSPIKIVPSKTSTYHGWAFVKTE